MSVSGQPPHLRGHPRYDVVVVAASLGDRPAVARMVSAAPS
jgi:hypothetical protein